jgi:cell fate regulator YaaT (PSP1 superfamily)
MLNLTPTKISGICGRLLCCLSYEDEHYKEQLEKYPAPYCMFKINNDNTGKVINCNVLKSTVTYSINNGYCKEISLKEFIELYGDKLDYSADNKKSENIVKKNI